MLHHVTCVTNGFWNFFMASLASRIHSSVLDKVLQALHVNLSGGHAFITTHCTSRSVNIFSNTNSWRYCDNRRLSLFWKFLYSKLFFGVFAFNSTKSWVSQDVSEKIFCICVQNLHFQTIEKPFMNDQHHFPKAYAK